MLVPVWLVAAGAARGVPTACCAAAAANYVEFSLTPLYWQVQGNLELVEECNNLLGNAGTPGTVGVCQREILDGSFIWSGRPPLQSLGQITGNECSELRVQARHINSCPLPACLCTCRLPARPPTAAQQA